MSGLTRAARPRTALAVVVTALALLCVVTPAALAQPVTYTSLAVSLLTEAQAGGPLLLVSAVVPDDVPLPVEVALPVPQGSEIEWAGEIMGGPIENDIRADAVIEERDGATVAVFTLTTSRVAQVEVVYPGATRVAEGGEMEAGFSFVTPNPATTARLAIALSPRGQVSSLPEGILASPGPDENTYYYTDVPQVAAGDTVELSLRYTLVTISPQPGSGAGDREVPAFLIIILAAVFAGAVLMLLASQSRARAAAVEDSAAESDDEGSFEDEEPGGARAESSHAEHVVDAGSAGDDAPPHSSEVEDGPSAAGPGAPAPSGGFLTPRVLLIVAAVLVLGIVVLLNTTGKESQVGVMDISNGWISQRISVADAAQETGYVIQITCGCPPESEAPKIFEALGRDPGVATASLEAATLVLRVGYDPALTDETAIADVLRSRGYLP